MASNYRKLGDVIKLVDERNVGGNVTNLLGVSIDKHFIPSVANFIGTDLTKYKVVRKNRFACSLMQVSRDHKMPISRYSKNELSIISPAYVTFELAGNDVLPEYLELWTQRTEFDREADFYAVGGVRGNMTWDELCGMSLVVPPIEQQLKIIARHNAIDARIEVLGQLNDKLAAILAHLYEALILNKFNEAKPKGWRYQTLASLCSKIGSGATPRGGKSVYAKSGVSLIRSANVFDYKFSYNDLAHINGTQASKLDSVIVEERDVLFNITGMSVARCCMVPASVLPARVNQHVMIIRPSGDLARWMSGLIMCTLCHPFFKQQLLGIGQSGSTREAINKGEMEAFKIIVPDDEVVCSFGRQVDAIYQQITHGIREIELLETARNAMLSQLDR